MGVEDEGLPEVVDFGELDGELVKAATVKVTGLGHLHRWPEDGERMVLAVEGEVKLDAVRRRDGMLVREMVLKATRLSEPGGDLADEVSAFLIRRADMDEGRAAIPGLLGFEQQDDGTWLDKATGETLTDDEYQGRVQAQDGDADDDEKGED